MSRTAADIATELLVAALQAGKVPLSGDGSAVGKTIGEAFTAIQQAVKATTTRS